MASPCRSASVSTSNSAGTIVVPGRASQDEACFFEFRGVLRNNSHGDGFQLVVAIENSI